jgi:hypothetical protein
MSSISVNAATACDDNDFTFEVTVAAYHFKMQVIFDVDQFKREVNGPL